MGFRVFHLQAKATTITVCLTSPPLHCRTVMVQQREFFIENLLVRIHLIIVMILEPPRSVSRTPSPLLQDGDGPAPLLRLEPPRGRAPYTPNPAPYIMRPQPYILHPTPYTICSTFCTLNTTSYNVFMVEGSAFWGPVSGFTVYGTSATGGTTPRSYSLRSNPYTLHPTPFTLNHTPYALHSTL